MLTPTDIADYGERHVEKWLTGRNFHCHKAPHTAHGHGHHQANHNSVDLEARNPELNMMVHVRTALAPHTAHELTEGEQHGLSSRAMMMGYEAWFARVQIDAKGELAQEIQWTKLV
ncbi:MAG: hypothetical protein U0984_00740 [Prosthecobacter sp.]|nr:hypothetical protein [Prosthecobacter sp.]